MRSDEIELGDPRAARRGKPFVEAAGVVLFATV
jgi:hypothetical protein